MRIVNWNIEWMNDWFVGGNVVQFRPNNPRTGITDTDALCTRIAQVITALGPDLLVVEEGPSDIREMELFVNTYLADSGSQPQYDVLGGLDGRSQKIYALVKRGGGFLDGRLSHDAPTLALDSPWECDVDGDLELEPYEFTRMPLVVEGELSEGGPTLRVVALHTKSKYVHDGRAQWEDPDTRPNFIRAAMVNRRRISSEAMRCRELLDELLGDDLSGRAVVTGDFNDGPGIDYFEKRYLTHNVTDILLGTAYRPERIFAHAFLTAIPENQRYTAIFDDYVDDIPNRRILLDHVLVSPALRNDISASGVAHAEYEAAIDHSASRRQRYPSDHRPVYVDLAA